MPHIDFTLTSMVFVSDPPRCLCCGKSMWLVRFELCWTALERAQF